MADRALVFAVAIVISAGMIAAAIYLHGRYDFVARGSEVLRLDRTTGAVKVCTWANGRHGCFEDLMRPVDLSAFGDPVEPPK